MHNTFDQTFSELIRAWSQHQDLKQRQAEIAQLSASRQRLDALRFEAALQRRVVTGGC